MIAASLRADMNPDSKMTVVVLSDHATRRTAEFFKVNALDASKHELIVSPLNNPNGPETRLPIYAGVSEYNGIPSHMVCDTPQNAWQYAAFHGYRVRAITSDQPVDAPTAH